MKTLTQVHLESLVAERYEDRYPFTRDGRTEYTGCKFCATVLDDDYEAASEHFLEGDCR